MNLNIYTVCTGTKIKVLYVLCRTLCLCTDIIVNLTWVNIGVHDMEDMQNLLTYDVS